jgi:hypothetical protein
MAPAPVEKLDTPTLTVEGREFKPAPFDNDAPAFGNRDYVWRDVPARFGGRRHLLLVGWLELLRMMYTQRRGLIEPVAGAFPTKGISATSANRDGNPWGRRMNPPMGGGLSRDETGRLRIP